MTELFLSVNLFWKTVLILGWTLWGIGLLYLLVIAIKVLNSYVHYFKKMIFIKRWNLNHPNDQKSL